MLCRAEYFMYFHLPSSMPSHLVSHTYASLPLTLHSNSVVSVDEIQKVARLEQGQGDDRDFGQFVDAAEPHVKHAEVKVDLDGDDEPAGSAL